MSATTWTTPDLAHEPVAWLGTSTPDGETALVPTWFAWDGTAFLVASKPGARKVRNARLNPHVMLGIARVGVEMEAQLVEGCAEVLPISSREAFAGVDLAKYEGLLAADGLTRDAFFDRYSAVIRIVPDRFLPWQGPALARVTVSGGSGGGSIARGAGLRSRLVERLRGMIPVPRRSTVPAPRHSAVPASLRSAVPAPGQAAAAPRQAAAALL